MGYLDPLRQCEHPGGCPHWTGLELWLIVTLDGERGYHWYCSHHIPEDAVRNWERSA